MSDLSSWDSTEEGSQLPEPFSNQQYGLGMKHSGGVMDLSKVLSEVSHQKDSEPEETPALAQNENYNGDRIYDSVDNIVAEKQGLDIEIETKLVAMQKTNTNEKNENPNKILDLKSKGLAINHIHDDSSPSSSGYIKDHNDHSNNDKSPYYEKIPYLQQKEPEEPDESDWDSPPLSEEQNRSSTKKMSLSKNDNIDISTFAFAKKENDLIDQVSNTYILKKHLTSSDKESSPSLTRYKDELRLNERFSGVQVKAGDNQQYSSLPLDTLHHELTKRLANQNRCEIFKKSPFTCKIKLVMFK